MEITEALKKYPGAVPFKFGDGDELCAWLLGLVRLGKKTATCSALRDYEIEGEPLPLVGRRDIAQNWDGTPALVIETTEVTIRLYREVEADFALAEGENDSLQGWRDDHREFFERNGGFVPDMELVCERFRMIEDLEAG